MKNNLLKYYIATVYLCSTFILFAQPGDTGDGTGGLEGTDTPAAPIDDYVWALAAIGLVYVFLKVRAVALRADMPKE
jgi:hypothetical protein